MELTSTLSEWCCKRSVSGETETLTQRCRETGCWGERGGEAPVQPPITHSWLKTGENSTNFENKDDSLKTCAEVPSLEDTQGVWSPTASRLGRDACLDPRRGPAAVAAGGNAAMADLVVGEHRSLCPACDFCSRWLPWDGAGGTQWQAWRTRALGSLTADSHGEKPAGTGWGGW